MPRRLTIDGSEAGFVLNQSESELISHLNAYQSDIRSIIDDRTLNPDFNARTFLAVLRQDVMRLQGRIEQLERSNAELREAFSRSVSAPAAATAPVSLQPATSGGAPQLPNGDTRRSAGEQPVRNDGTVHTATGRVDLLAGSAVVVVQQPPSNPGVSIDAIRSALQRYSQANGMENARRLMQQFGFQAVSQVPENRRAELLAAIERASAIPQATVQAGA